MTLGGTAYTCSTTVIPIAAGLAESGTTTYAVNVIAADQATPVNTATGLAGLVVVDDTRPTANCVDLLDRAGATAGRMEAGDTVDVRWGEVVEPHVALPTVPATTPPSGWSGAAGVPVTVRLTDQTTDGGTDALTVLSPAGALLPLGSTNLGGNTCVGGADSTSVDPTGSTMTGTGAIAGSTVALGTTTGTVATVAGRPRRGRRPRGWSTGPATR